MNDIQVKTLLANLQKAAKKGWTVIGFMSTGKVDFYHPEKGHRLVDYEEVEDGIQLTYKNKSTRVVKYE